MPSITARCLLSLSLFGKSIRFWMFWMLPRLCVKMVRSTAALPSWVHSQVLVGGGVVDPSSYYHTILSGDEATVRVDLPPCRGAGRLRAGEV